MSTDPGRDSFVGKWRARWPEWQVAEAFVAKADRGRALAWLALRQELLDAAWAGADPRPGEAKLAWWAEELQGWAQGRRRHPLGVDLQASPAPWARLAAALPALAAARPRATGLDEALATLAPFAEAVAAVEGALAGEGHPPAAAAMGICLLGQRALGADDDAVPLQVRARLGAPASAQEARAAWIEDLLRAWPPPQGTCAGRIHAALLRERLRRGGADGPLSRWRTLATAWRAARRQSVPQP